MGVDVDDVHMLSPRVDSYADDSTFGGKMQRLLRFLPAHPAEAAARTEALTASKEMGA